MLKENLVVASAVKILLNRISLNFGHFAYNGKSLVKALEQDYGKRLDKAFSFRYFLADQKIVFSFGVLVGVLISLW